MRGIISAVYGSLYSLIILLPDIGIFFNMLIKLFAAVTIVLIAFGFGGIKRLIINTVCFFAVNFIFAGFIFAVYIWLKPSFIYFENTYFYIDFSLLLLIFITSFLYTALSIFRYFSDRNLILSSEYRITIKYMGKSVTLDGLADTGNSLVDFFTGKPVIICSPEEISGIVNLSGTDSPEKFLKLKGFRIIPYSTISGSGMIPVFSPDEIILINAQTGSQKSINAMIGIHSSEKKAIFNPSLLKL